jgi:hypothetical protein
MNQVMRKPDADLTYGASENSLSKEVGNIANVLAQVPGEADGPSWYWLAKMKNGKYGLFWGGCDYTGWECQSSMWYKEADSAEEVVEFLKFEEWEQDAKAKKPIKQQLLDQLEGKQPYGLREG